MCLVRLLVKAGGYVDKDLVGQVHELGRGEVG